MDRPRTRGITDGLLVIGLTASLIGLAAVAIPLTELTAIDPSFTFQRRASPVVPAAPMTSYVESGDHAADVTAASDPPDTFPTPPPGRIGDWDSQDEPGDARLYVQDSAALAHRYPWAGPWRGETRTELWVNAPSSIGSTSPPEAGAVTPAVGE